MASKIRLDLDELAVESFPTTAPDDPSAGTVFALASDGSTCAQLQCTCDSDNGTCDGSCNYTCALSCGSGCGTGTTTNPGDSKDVTCVTGVQLQCSCYW